jgi:hypothetical protein
MEDGTRNAVLDLSELWQKLEAAKELIKNNNHEIAFELLREILEIERKQAGKEALFAEANALSIQLNRSRSVRKSRLILISIFSFTLGLVLLLALVKVGSTEVELKLRLNQFTFKLAKNWEISSLEIQSIGIWHLGDLRLDAVFIEEAIAFDRTSDLPTKWQSSRADGPLSIKRTHDNWGVTIESSYLRLAHASIDSGSTITIAAYEDASRQFRIAVSGGAVLGSIDTDETYAMTCASCQIEGHPNERHTENKALHITSDVQEISFEDLAGSIEMIVKIPQTNMGMKPYLFGKSIYTEQLDFSRLEGDSRESTITKDGSIYFSELDGKQIEIKEGDFLVVNGLRDFQIKRLFFEDHLEAILKGSAQELRSGTQEFLYDRLPSWLEWIYTNQFFALVIATLIPVFSVILVVFYRLKIIEES